MKRLLCIRLPSWPIQRLVVAQPELNGRMIILHARDPRRGQQVVGCSRAAYRSGVRTGMALAEATALTPSDTHLAEHSLTQDATVLEQLAQWCERFSPLVGFEHIAPFHTHLPDSHFSRQNRRTDCLYLEVTHLASYFGSEQQLARLIAEAFSERGYLVHIAVANTIGAAWAFAHFGLPQATVVTSPRDTVASPLDTMTTTQRTSFLVVPPEATEQALRSLPVTALRLPHNTLHLLHQLGITQIAQLACLPRASLTARFGDVLLKRWDQATGHVEEVLVVHHSAPQFETQWILEYPTTSQAAIRSILYTLTQRLANTLRARGEGVIQCVCRLTCTHHPDSPSLPSPAPPSPCISHSASSQPPITFRIGLFQPTASVEHLQQLFQMQLEQLQLPGPVELIVLEASLTAPLAHRQQELFSDTRRHASSQLASLIDRLSSRLGASNVVQARPQRDAQPEYAYHYLPLTGGQHHFARRSRRTRHTRSSRRKAADSRLTDDRSVRRRRLIRPLHLRSAPLPLSVVALAPDGPPARLSYHQQTFRVARCWGPERIETGWWRGQSVRRDYYRLETETGHWLWIFRQLNDNQWFLHGLFG